MRKRYMQLVLCLLMFCSLGLTACSNTDNRKEKESQGKAETTTWTGGDSLITGETKQLTEPPAAWKISEETKLKSEKIVYNPKTDGTWRFAGDEACETENGNYYQIIDRYNPGAFLYAINPDGTGRIKVQTLKTVEKRKDHYNVSQINIDFIIHRGYVYYEQNLGHPLERDDYYRNGKNCIFRVPLGGNEAEAECIYVLSKLQDAEGVYDQRDIWMKPYGTYVYFLESVFNPDHPEEGLISELRRIDTGAKQVEKIPLEKEPDIYFYVTEEGIYYNDVKSDGDLWLHHLETGDDELVADFTSLSEYQILGSVYDGTYRYVYVQKDPTIFTTYMIILDEDHQKIGEIDFGTHMYTVAETKQQMVIFTEDNKLYGWLNKADIAKGDLNVHRAEQTE